MHSLKTGQQVNESRVLVAIPVYNEAKHIADLVSQVKQFVNPLDILVVNDGSTDHTAQIIETLSVKIVHHSINSGKGQAIKTAVRYALARQYEWIICLDGDGQHDPAYIPAFKSCIYNNTCDLILGNRQIRSENMPVHRRLSNGTTSVMVSLCCGQRVHDSQCGYRAVRVKSLDLSKYTENGFQFESEMILRMGKSARKIVEIPTRTIYKGESSSIHLFKDTMRFIRLILKSFTW